tara:strand:+ start:25 stop:855 length:831 start_codon:yes stop_codon:yes gene_type:complete
MAVTNGWGQGAKDNTIDWGQGATDNTISWGKSQTLSASGDTNITGASSFVNTKSILLDGVDDTVNLGAPTNLRFERTDSFSFSCWVKPANADFHAVFTNSDTGSTFRGYYLQIKSDNTLSLFLRNNLTVSGRIIVTSTATVTTGAWNHIAFTYDGSSTGAGVKIYINGAASTTSSTGALSATISSSNTIYLGSRNAADNFFQGNLDECAVFNTELSASNITAIYGTGEPNDITDLSPLSWWRCGDGDTSPTLTDNGSGGNNGTMENFTAFSTDVPT